jgi:hypothetical protein
MSYRIQFWERGFESIFTTPNIMPKLNTIPISNLEGDKIGEEPPTIPNIGYVW